MNSYSRFQRWAKNGFSIDIPELNSSGLCQFIVDDTYCINIYANPVYEHIDPVFIYIPIVNIQGLSSKLESEILWYITSINMPGILPLGFKFATKKDNGFIWIVGSFDITYMSSSDFDLCIQQAISLARHYEPKINELIVDTDRNDIAKSTFSINDFMKYSMV